MGGKRAVAIGRYLLDAALDFWRWSASDLISNATRGILAEFIVARAMGINLKTVRDEWAPYDLLSPEGIKIEVKASGYLQSWAQRDYSKIVFSIAPARAWNKLTNAFEGPAARHADVYIFCVLKHKEAQTLNPLQLEQWEFYVLPTLVINQHFPAQKSITLKRLQKITETIGYDQLQEHVIEQHYNRKSKPKP